MVRYRSCPRHTGVWHPRKNRCAGQISVSSRNLHENGGFGLGWRGVEEVSPGLSFRHHRDPRPGPGPHPCPRPTRREQGQGFTGPVWGPPDRCVPSPTPGTFWDRLKGGQRQSQTETGIPTVGVGSKGLTPKVPVLTGTSVLSTYPRPPHLRRGVSRSHSPPRRPHPGGFSSPRSLGQG